MELCEKMIWKHLYLVKILIFPSGFTQKKMWFLISVRWKRSKHKRPMKRTNETQRVREKECVYVCILYNMYMCV